MYNVILTIVVILSLLYDVSYYARVTWSYFLGRLLQKRIKITDTGFYYDFSLSDMHSGRYLTLLDCSRIHFCYLSGFGAKLDQAKSGAVVGAHNVLHILPIRRFTFYRIETKLLYWDDRRMIFENKFVTLSDGKVRAVFQTITFCVGSINMAAAMADMPDADTLKQLPEQIGQFQKVLKTTNAKLTSN